MHANGKCPFWRFPVRNQHFRLSPEHLWCTGGWGVGAEWQGMHLGRLPRGGGVELHPPSPKCCIHTVNTVGCHSLNPSLTTKPNLRTGMKVALEKEKIKRVHIHVPSRFSVHFRIWTVIFNYSCGQFSYCNEKAKRFWEAFLCSRW